MPLDLEDYEQHLRIASQFILEANRHLKDVVDGLDKTSGSDMFRAGCIVEDMQILLEIHRSLGQWRSVRCLRPRGPTAWIRSTASSPT